MPTNETPTNEAALPTAPKQSLPSKQITLYKKDHKATTEWLLPQQISQTKILGPWFGSNACTIIATLFAAKLKSKTLQIPLDVTGIQNTVNIFIQAMKEGNNLYNSFDVDPCQANLEVRDVLSRLPYLDLQIVEDAGYFFEEDLLTKFVLLSQQPLATDI